MVEDEKEGGQPEKETEPDVPKSIVLPIDGILDLHAFRPADVKDLLAEYLAACRQRGILQVRVIHGKGTGEMRRAVRAYLERIPGVVGVRTAPEIEGGWGDILMAGWPWHFIDNAIIS